MVVRPRPIPPLSRDPLWRILAHRGLGVPWLARRLEVHYSTVWNYRRGYAVPTQEFRNGCVQALDLPEWVLFLSTESELDATEETG